MAKQASSSWFYALAVHPLFDKFQVVPTRVGKQYSNGNTIVVHAHVRILLISHLNSGRDTWCIIQSPPERVQRFQSPYLHAYRSCHVF